MSNYPNHVDRALLDLVEHHAGDDFVREFQSSALHRVMEAEVGEITCAGKGDGKKAGKSGKRTRTKLEEDKERDILKDQIENLNRMIGEIKSQRADVPEKVVSHSVVEIPDRICGRSNIAGNSGKGRKSRRAIPFVADSAPTSGTLLMDEISGLKSRPKQIISRGDENSVGACHVRVIAQSTAKRPQSTQGHKSLGVEESENMGAGYP